ncbi:hypothetical protein [Gulosibacter molinativorax]|uniref:Bacterial sugar transferase domain-containing protein n=1 Tax=Gulosibacter molinativorax TaxID=256821 RepID=A0ABT7C632_9MICO|nr:hypothetical protein [Gulosibacter molinativorax]MDJ1370638.1 hypothetical protein [Gulosibacter molinativorax]QUY63339.1 Hypotetical protein [Gulosibacter molinativorax]
MTTGIPDKPSNPRLARLYDKHLKAGDEIRAANEEALIVWHQNEWGCAGWLLLITLGIVTAFIVPLILWLLGAFSKDGQLITYTIKRSGGVKKHVKYGAK